MKRKTSIQASFIGQFVCGCALVMSSPSMGTAGTSIDVSYVGQDKAHLTYGLALPGFDAADPQVGQFRAARMQVRDGSDGVSVLVGGLPPSHAPENYLAGGLTEDTYVFELEAERVTAIDPLTFAWAVVYQTAPVTIDGSVGGELLFNETLQPHGDGTPVSVAHYLQVESSFSLDISGVHLVGEGLGVRGTIVYNADSSTAQPITFLRPYDITDAVNLNLAYSSDSTPSHVSGGSNLVVRFTDPQGSTVSGVKSLTVNATGVGSLTVTDCSIQGDCDVNVAMDAIGQGKLILRNMPSGGNLFRITGFEVEISNCMLGTRTEVRAGKITAASCLFGQFLVAANSGQITQCGFTGVVEIYPVAPVFTQCEFGGHVILRNRSAVTIGQCMFHSYLHFASAAGTGETTWYDALTPMPTITGNSFLGPVAWNYGDSSTPVPPADFVDIGPNYYASPNGPRPAGGSFLYWDASFLDIYGSYQLGPMCYNKPTSIAAPLPDGPRTKQSNRILPQFWVNGWVSGQNVTGNTTHRMRGRQTLLSVDVLTSDYKIKGARVYVEADGQTLELLNPVILTRAGEDVSAESRMNGYTTCNFALPPTQADRQDFDVYLDPTSLSDYHPDILPTNSILLLHDHIDMDLVPPDRALNLLVVPIGIHWNFSTSGPASAGAITPYLQDLLPAMLPLRRQDVHVIQGAPHFATCRIGFLTTTALLNWLAVELELYRESVNLSELYFGGEPYDFIVAVMPADSMATIDLQNWVPTVTAAHGASLGWGRRGIVFVDESHPSAVLHELGHGMDLYTEGMEQYDLYPETGGMPLESFSAFAPEGVERHQAIARQQVLHFPHPSALGWGREHGWLDIMGAEDEKVWIAPFVYQSMSTWLGSHLYGAPALMSFNEQSPVTLATPPAPGFRRLSMRALLRSPDGTITAQIVPESLVAFDATLLDVAADEPPSTGYFKHPHRIVGWDGASNVVYDTTFYIPYIDIDHRDLYGWDGTLDVPDAMRSFTITPLWPTFPTPSALLQVRSGGTLLNTLQPPVPGRALPERFRLRWSAAASDPGPGVTLRHRLFYRAAAAADWIPIGAITTATAIELPRDFLPVSSTIQFRVVTSDGIASVESISAAYEVDVPAPSVCITVPLDGQKQPAGTGWALVGSVYAPDGSDVADGTWTSSIQGELGTGPRLTDLVLSNGTHTLTYRVQSTNGQWGEATVRVSVGNILSADIALTKDSLWLHVPGRDQHEEGPVLLRPDEVHLLRVRCAGVGTNIAGRLRLLMLPPEGDWQLLGEKDVAVDAFEALFMDSSFTPTNRGTYRFRAMVDNLSLPDPDTSNNAHEWAFGTIQPKLRLAPLAISIERSFFDGQVLPNYQDSNVALIHSSGRAPLLVQSLELLGPDVDRFTLLGSDCLGVPLAPETFGRVQVRYTPLAKGRADAVLRIGSDDPLRPVVDVPLIARFYDFEDWTDTDGDGLLDIEENTGCTRADLADSDDDGLADGVEDANHNGVVDPGETDPCLADSDRDGLNDGVEDENANGAWDYGESSAARADTDGDGMPDGSEIIAGTAPFMAGDYLHIHAVSEQGTCPALHWESREGHTYQVYRSPDLSDWSPSPSGVSSNQQSRQTAQEDASLTYEDPAFGTGPAFYQIRVVP